jgi:hypothetical protein
MAKEKSPAPSDVALSYAPNSRDFGNGRAFVAAAVAIVAIMCAMVFWSGTIITAQKMAILLALCLAMIPPFVFGLRLLKGDARFEADAEGLTYYYFGETRHRPWPETGPLQLSLLTKFSLPRLYFPEPRDLASHPFFHWRRLTMIEPYSIPFGTNAAVLEAHAKLAAFRERMLAKDATSRS